jgi:hypothetical protein
MLKGYPDRPWDGSHSMLKPSFRHGSRLSCNDGSLVTWTFGTTVIIVPIALVLTIWFPAITSVFLIILAVWNIFILFMIKGSQKYDRADAEQLIKIERAYHKMSSGSQKEYRNYLQAAYDGKVTKAKVLALFEKHAYATPELDKSTVDAEIDGLLAGYEQLNEINGRLDV